jgi:hypothetical protein
VVVASYSPGVGQKIYLISILILGFMADQNTLRRQGTGLFASAPAAASPGYRLFAPLTGTSQAYLVGLDGTVAHQ